MTFRKKFPIGVLASGGGTNLQAIMDAIEDKRLNAEIRVVISNNSRSPALKRARAAETRRGGFWTAPAALKRARGAGIPTAHLSGVTHPDPDALDAAIADTLANRGVEVVALAGYMKMLGPQTLARFRNRVVNVHPALLPKFGGRGMYGERVHAAVLAAGERETGVTVHLVNGEYDSGPAIAQERVPVLAGDTPSALAARVLEREHALYPQIIQRVAAGEIDLDRIAAGDIGMDAPAESRNGVAKWLTIGLTRRRAWIWRRPRASSGASAR